MILPRVRDYVSNSCQLCLCCATAASNPLPFLMVIQLFFAYLPVSGPVDIAGLSIAYAYLHHRLTAVQQ